MLLLHVVIVLYVLLLVSLVQKRQQQQQKLSQNQSAFHGKQHALSWWQFHVFCVYQSLDFC